jgi:hypothetical protein
MQGWNFFKNREQFFLRRHEHKEESTTQTGRIRPYPIAFEFAQRTGYFQPEKRKSRFPVEEP